MTTLIPISRPQIGDLELQFVADAVLNGWNQNYYQWIDRFEREFAQWCQVNHCIATSSATGALDIALQTLGVTAGDEVILADTNWIATAAPIVRLGARPVFVDVDAATYCIDAKHTARAITDRTRAIIATHIYGNVCDMQGLMSLGVPVIEDCAEALGSQVLGRPVGGLGSMAVFSFHHSKSMTSGEGGALVTNDAGLYSTAWQVANHGRRREQTRQIWSEAIGVKYKMSNIQAALACAQLQRLPAMVARRQQILRLYQANLRLPGIRISGNQIGATNGAWMPIADFAYPLGFEQAARCFREDGIQVREFFPPLSSMPMFEPASTSVAAYLHQQCICLPCWPDMTTDEILRVVNALRRALGLEGLVDLQQ